MDTALLSRYAAPLRMALEFDDWTHRLQSVCGEFHPHRYENRAVVTGHVGVLQAGGLA